MDKLLEEANEVWKKYLEPRTKITEELFLKLWPFVDPSTGILEGKFIIPFAEETFPNLGVGGVNEKKEVAILLKQKIQDLVKDKKVDVIIDRKLAFVYSDGKVYYNNAFYFTIY